MAGDKKERRKVARKKVQAPMEFILYLDAFKADAVNFSDKGLCFETKAPLMIELLVNLDGKRVLRKAHLVWAKKNEDGVMTYGFEFVPEDEKKD